MAPRRDACGGENFEFSKSSNVKSSNMHGTTIEAHARMQARMRVTKYKYGFSFV